MTLVGDAAHTMSMCTSSFLVAICPNVFSFFYSGPSPGACVDILRFADRGEGFNHAILDAHRLFQTIQEISSAVRTADGTWLEERERAIREYERETRARGEVAVAMCRESCLEVHYWEKLSENSVVRRTRHYA